MQLRERLSDLLRPDFREQLQKALSEEDEYQRAQEVGDLVEGADPTVLEEHLEEVKRALRMASVPHSNTPEGDRWRDGWNYLNGLAFDFFFGPDEALEALTRSSVGAWRRLGIYERLARRGQHLSRQQADQIREDLADLLDDNQPEIKAWTKAVQERLGLRISTRGQTR